MGEPLTGKPVKKLKKSKESTIAQYSEAELLDDVGLSSLDDVYESLKAGEKMYWNVYFIYEYGCSFTFI